MAIAFAAALTAPARDSGRFSIRAPHHWFRGVGGRALVSEAPGPGTRGLTRDWLAGPLFNLRGPPGWPWGHGLPHPAAYPGRPPR